MYNSCLQIIDIVCIQINLVFHSKSFFMQSVSKFARCLGVLHAEVAVDGVVWLEVPQLSFEAGDV